MLSRGRMLRDPPDADMTKTRLRTASRLPSWTATTPADTVPRCVAQKADAVPKSPARWIRGGREALTRRLKTKPLELRKGDTKYPQSIPQFLKAHSRAPQSHPQARLCEASARPTWRGDCKHNGNDKMKGRFRKAGNHKTRQSFWQCRNCSERCIDVQTAAHPAAM